MDKGFTLIELIVTIAIIAVLSGIILFTVTQYINKGKDSNISGTLTTLSTAGEAFYNSTGYSYKGFCDPASTGSVLKNSIYQMPQTTSTTSNCKGGVITNPSAWAYNSNPAGVCCYPTSTDSTFSDGQSWAACAQEFANPKMAYCVDSRGMREEMCNSQCTYGKLCVTAAGVSACSCPTPLSTCP